MSLPRMVTLTNSRIVDTMAELLDPCRVKACRFFALNLRLPDYHFSFRNEVMSFFVPV